jgi:hypothetical protein
MSSKELISEIQRTFDSQKNLLRDTRDYLKELEKHIPKEVGLSKNLRKIFTEDRNLLEGLAK